VTIAVLALFVVVTGAKLWLAAHLDLLPDEGFYWLCSRQLDLAYADHPFMTALMVRAGTDLAGGGTLGVRAPFVAAGALVPILLFALARPLVGHRDALMAFDDFEAPGGETLEGVRARVLDFVSNLPAGRHLVFTHGGVIRILTRDLGIDRFVPNGTLVAVQWTQKKVLFTHPPVD